jgi:ABC-2 type transport system permease protein
VVQRILAILRKELTQTLRDRRTLGILILMPLLQLVLFGYAIHMTITHIPMVAADQSMDAESRSFLDDLTASQYFDIVERVSDQAQIIRAIDEGRARAGVFIPPDFAGRAGRGEAEVVFYVDGSDMFTSQSASTAADLISQNHAIQLRLDSQARFGAEAPALPLDAHVQVMYNPDVKDLWFIIPGMIAMLLQQECLILTAMGIVRERENGTLEQILVTPIRPIELMIGKMLPNMIIAVVNVLTILALAVFWFHMPFRGNLWLFLALALVFSLSGLALGLLISSAVDNQRQAAQVSMAISLVGLILAGVFFPRYAMPEPIQWIGSLIPITHFIPIARGIISKGVGWEAVYGNALAVLAYLVIALAVAARAFRQRLD